MARTVPGCGLWDGDFKASFCSTAVSIPRRLLDENVMAACDAPAQIDQHSVRRNCFDFSTIELLATLPDFLEPSFADWKVLLAINRPQQLFRQICPGF